MLTNIFPGTKKSTTIYTSRVPCIQEHSQMQNFHFPKSWIKLYLRHIQIYTTCLGAYYAFHEDEIKTVWLNAQTSLIWQFDKFKGSNSGVPGTIYLLIYHGRDIVPLSMWPSFKRIWQKNCLTKRADTFVRWPSSLLAQCRRSHNTLCFKRAY